MPSRHSDDDAHMQLWAGHGAAQTKASPLALRQGDVSQETDCSATRYVTLGRLPNCSGPQVPHLYNEDNCTHFMEVL